jgi:hypothetical protein
MISILRAEHVRENTTDIRASVCLILLLVAVILVACGSALNHQQVFPEDSNDGTAVFASEFALNRAAAAGRLFRDSLGVLRIKSSDFCPT